MSCLRWFQGESVESLLSSLRFGFLVFFRHRAFLPLSPASWPCSTYNVQVIKYATMSPTWQPSLSLQSLTSLCRSLPNALALPFPVCAAEHLEKSDILQVNRPAAVHQLLGFPSPSLFSFTTWFLLLTSLSPLLYGPFGSFCFVHSVPLSLFVCFLFAHQRFSISDRCVYPCWYGIYNMSVWGHWGHRFSNGSSLMMISSDYVQTAFYGSKFYRMIPSFCKFNDDCSRRGEYPDLCLRP